MTPCRLLEVQKAENGNKWPETIAVVLWGTDNIKTYGESLAQVRRQGPHICSGWIPDSSSAGLCAAALFTRPCDNAFEARVCIQSPPAQRRM